MAKLISVRRSAAAYLATFASSRKTSEISWYHITSVGLSMASENKLAQIAEP